MRKIIASFVIVMLFSMISVTAFAGKIDFCEEIKFKPEYKGLYGLCNAYWNEDDEENRALILENFRKKAGPLGPDMPGLFTDIPVPGEPTPVVCPCWPDGEIDLGVEPVDCDVTEDQMIAVYDSWLVQYGTGILLGLGSDSSCEYNNLDLGQFHSITGLSAEELEVCSDDLMARLIDDFGGCL